MLRERIVDAARGCIGTPYRPQGRQPGVALDCVGLAAVAVRASGRCITVPADYDICADHNVRLTRTLQAIGLTRCADGRVQPGDLLVFQPGVARQHLAIATEQGFVHAHLGLRRVVETPAPAIWPLIAVWLITERK